jgi:hypothetical protein
LFIRVLLGVRLSYPARAEALNIDAGTKRRVADKRDLAQEQGEVAK